jgi:hypothetical protein
MKKIVFILSLLACQSTVFAQLGVGTNSPDASAQLDVTASNKGFLAPRIALTSATDVTTIATPATGLMIYNTATAGTSPNDVIPGYYYYDGVKWVRFINSSQESKWSNVSNDSLVKLNFLSDGVTARTGNTNFRIHDRNALIIGDISPSPGSFFSDKSIVAKKTGNNSLSLIADGGIYSSYGAEIYGGSSIGAAAYLTLMKYRGSATSPAVVQTGDLIGIIDFRGGTGVGTGFVNGARIITAVDGAVNTSLSPASIPMSFDFLTVAPGQTAPNSRLKIASNGYVGIGVSNPVSTFSNTATPIQGSNSTNAFTGGLTWSTPGTGFAASFYSQPSNGNGLQVKIAGNSSTNNALEISSSTSQDATTPLIPLLNVKGNGNVGIGISSPSYPLEIATTGVGALIRRASTSLAASNLVFQKSASSDPAVNTALANGDYIGRILFSAGNGTNYPLNGTDIVGYAVGAQTTTNNGGGIFFRTVPQNSVAQSFERMRIEHNGFVGIGTTSPTTNLDVVGGFSLRNVTGAAGTNYGIEFNTNSSAPRIDWVFNGAYIGQFASDANDFQLRNSKLSTGGFRFYTNPAGTQVERMTILNNGNVGVNTSAPTASFHVTGVIMQDMTSQDNFSNGINIRKRGNTTSSTGAAASGAEIGYHSFYGWNGTAYARGAYVFVSAAENYTSTANGTNYSIYTTAVGSTSTIERLKIAHNGNIGIGTGNPNGALTLFGPSSLTLPTNIQGSTGATKELVFGRGGLTTGFAAITGVDNGQYGGGLSFVVKPTGTNDFPTNAIQAMVLDWNGNAGIGTNSPTQRLDVNGQVRIRTINAGTSSDSLLVVNGGVIKSVAKSASVNTQTGNYTLTSTDNGGILIMNAAAAVTVTIPATLPAGFVVQIIQKGAGQITVAGSGVTINSANGLKSRTLNSAIGVVMETSTLGYITGDSNF